MSDPGKLISLGDWLQATGAHHDVVEWAGAFGADWTSAWASCPRGDWLLGIAGRLGADRRALALAAVDAVREALDFVPEDEPRPARALGVVERWARGEATETQCRDAVASLEDSPPDPAIAMVFIAAQAAAMTPEDPDAAASAAANAAQAAILGVADCAMMAAVGHAHDAAARCVRERIPFESLELPG